MVRKFYVFCLVSLLLPWCENMAVVPKKETISDEQSEYTSVCTNGELTLSERGVNKLPVGFSGNYPSIGVYEIGNYAGEEGGKKCPYFDFGLSKSTTIQVTVAFSSNPLYFPSNTVMKMLGYEVSVLSSDGQVKAKTVTKEASQFGDLFETHGDYGQGGSDETDFRTNFYLYYPANAVGLSITLQAGDKLSYVRFIYGDLPQSIVNASLFLENPDFKTCCLTKPTTPDCSSYDYTEELGTHVVYHMISPFGSYYSQDYLLSCFLVKDYVDGKVYHPELIYDPDKYFQNASSAALGTTFTVQIIATDSRLNQADVTFNFTVGDLTGPMIQPFNNSPLSVSYSLLKKEEFLKENFSIVDNLDGECSAEVLDSEGNEFNEKQVGTFYLQLKSEDSHGNSTSFPFEVTLIDDIPPRIDADQEEIVLTADSVVTSDYLLSLFHCTDEIDGDCAVKIKENNYTENCKVPGNYSFTVEAMDQAMNCSEKTIKLLVQDDNEGPVFFTKQSSLTFIEGRIPTEEEIVSSLIRNGTLPDKNYVSFQTISGTPITDGLASGEYQSTMLFTADDNSTEMIDLVFSVIAQEDSEVSLPEKELSWWDKFLQFWQDLWEKIISFFHGSGN